MTIKSVKINNNLYLSEVSVDVGGAKKAPDGVNHIFIYDRSGSMYGNLSGLCEDLKKRFRTLTSEDTLTLGWFSGEGDFNFVLKGFRITSDADRKKLDQVVDANSTTLGTTCFSEILADTDKVVKDLSAFNNSFALTFLTDGYPVVSNYTKEVNAIVKAIETISGKISSSLFVGYGDYYNKELMASMAGKLGGSLIHSGDLAKFSFAYDEFIQSSRGADRVVVDVPVDDILGGVVFTVDDSAVIAYELTDGKAYVRNADGKPSIYVLSTKAPVKVTANAVGFDKAMYAAALTMIQRSKVDVALDVLSTIGDVGLVNKASSAFTNEEFGRAEQAIVDAIKYPRQRFKEGQKVGCIPDKKAFCALDAIEQLMSDEEAEFQPFHDEFTYKKIGRASVTKDGYPEFKPDRESRVPLTGLVWNSTRLNLSIRALIKGTIQLKDGYKKFGLPKEYETSVYRTYTLVRDGVLNVQKLPVSMSKKTYNLFVEQGIVDKETRHYAGRVYVVHFDRIPIMNRAIAENYTSAKKLVALAAEELKLEAYQKVLNTKLAELEPEKKIQGVSDEVAAFLKENGVTPSGFNPPVEKAEATDFYMAKEFEIKASGFSSLPKVAEVEQKIKDKKKLAGAAELLANAIKEMKSVKTASSVKSELANVRSQLVSVRSELQKAKFAVVLGNKWFEEFSSRAGCELAYNDKAGSGLEYNFKFELSEKKIEI